MPQVKRHADCPEANPRPTQNGRLLRPAGDVKTVYYRRDGRLIKAGWLCLDCLRFEPFFGRLKRSPHTYI